MVDKEIMLKELDRIEKMNIAYIKEHKTFSTMALIYTEEGIKIMSLLFKNYEEKRIMQLMLKDFILKNKTHFYIFNSDTLITIMSKEGNKTYDCLVTMLFSPEITIQRAYFHDGKGKKIKVKEIDKESINLGNCEWNCWNPQEKSEDYEEIAKKYNDYKEKNKDRFKSVS